MRAVSVALLIVLISATVVSADDWVAQPFTLRTPEGKVHSLSDYRGKVVVLEFFASWCGVCADSVPEINALAKRYPGKLEVVAVATAEDDPNGLEAFIEDNRPEYTILVDETDQVARQYRVLIFPMYFVIDGEGKVQSFRRGVVNWESPKVTKFLEGLVFPAPVSATPAMPAPITTVSLP